MIKIADIKGLKLNITWKLLYRGLLEKQISINEIVEYREICLPREVINIYPKHCEWVEKCICEHRVCFLVQESQINAGCAVVKVSDKYHFLIKLCFLYVLPWYRSNGYGKKLVDAVENYAFVNSLSGVYMTVNPKVNSMQKFISRCGYAKCGETDDGDYVFKRIFSS